MQDGVVLAHGIFRTYRSMARMGRFLEEKGYAVLNEGYPSTRHPLEELADVIHPGVERFANACEGKLHFVGYSMGGLLIRTYLHRYRPAKLGRVVMLGTPNNGSEIADFLQNSLWYRKLYGAAGQQLITKQQAFSHLWGDVDYEAGIIAGNRTIDPIGSYIIGKANDGKVSVESTRLEGMRDHIVIPATHTFFPSNKIALEQTLHFLQQGCFSYRN